MAAWIDTTTALVGAFRRPSPPSPPRSALVARLSRPGLDPARRRLRALLLRLPDERLRQGLGLSDADVAALRAAGLGDLQGPGGDLAAPGREAATVTPGRSAAAAAAAAADAALSAAPPDPWR
jgi:hypothetical protein